MDKLLNNLEVARLMFDLTQPARQRLANQVIELKQEPEIYFSPMGYYARWRVGHLSLEMHLETEGSNLYG